MTEELHTVILCPTTAHLHLRHPPSGSESRSISFDVYVHERFEVNTPGPAMRDLQRARWAIHLVEAEMLSDPAKADAAIGNLRYFEAISVEGDVADDVSAEPELCNVMAILRPDIFASLLNTVQAGYLPDTILVTVKGLTMGYAPDGSEIIWDIDRMPTLPVVAIEFNIPLVTPTDHAAASAEAEEGDR
jgi:hypothetical protein